MKRTWMVTLALLLTGLMMFSFVGCEEDEEGNLVVDGDLWPIAVGNSWTYERVTVTQTETITDTLVLVIDDAVTYEGRTGYRIIATEYSATWSWADTQYVAVSGDSVFLAGRFMSGDEGEFEFQFLFDPEMVGTPYFHENDGYHDMQRVLVEIGATVETPSGTYNDVWEFDEVTDMSSTDYTFIEHWLFHFQPGIGPVTYNACYSVYDDGTHEDDPYLLVSYNIGQD